LTVRRSGALFGGVLLATLTAVALAAQAPATDIYVADLTFTGGRAQVGAPRNVTRRPGYDNQPAFLPDGRSFLYTSIRADGQADIYRYDPSADSGRRVTTTPESEYSATPLADGGFAVVRVEADSTQRLWRFDALGGHPTLVLEHVKPVGYFAFGDEHTLGLFVLGQPASFQVADTRSGRADTLATNIGRTVQRVPGRRAVSFVRRGADSASWITVYDLETRALTPVVRTPDNVDFYAWTPGGALLAGRGTRLYQWTSGTAWEEIADLAAAGLTGITRLAVSPLGDRLAIVAVPSTGDAR
jgi:hypothetical protein